MTFYRKKFANLIQISNKIYVRQFTLYIALKEREITSRIKTRYRSTIMNLSQKESKSKISPKRTLSGFDFDEEF